MDRLAFYDEQVVDDTDMTALEDAIEASLGRMHADHLLLLKGILSGLDVAPTSPASMSVQVAPGVAYDGTSGKPQRIAVPSVQTVNTAIDANGNSTIPAAGLSKIIYLVARFARNAHNDKIQADGTPAPYNLDEGFQLQVYGGADGASPSPPTIPVDAVVLASWTNTHATTAITAVAYANRMAGYWQGVAGGGHGGYGPPLPTLPLGIAAAVLAISGPTYGNLQVYALEPQGTGNTVVVNSGWASNGQKVLRVNQASIAVTMPAAGSFDIALIYLDQNGNPQITYAGAQVGSYPNAPNHRIGIPLAEVSLDGTQPGIAPSAIADVRPFIGNTPPSVSRQRYAFTAVGGETAIAIVGWQYVVGNASLEVFKNGALVPQSQYTETNSSTVTLHSPLALNDVVEFVADVPSGSLSVTRHAATHAVDGPDPIDYSSAVAIGAANAHIYVDDPTTSLIKVEPLTLFVGGRMLLNPLEKTLDPVANFATLMDDGMALAAETWYYLYAYYNASADLYHIQFELSKQQPALGNLWKGGDPSRAYLGAFRSNGSAHLKPCRRIGRRTLYQGSATALYSGDDYGLVLATKVAAYATANDYVDTSRLVPPTTKRGLFFIATNTAEWVTSLGTPLSDSDNSGVGRTFISMGLGTASPNGYAVIQGEGQTDGNRRVVFGGDAGKSQMGVMGFMD